ncbi:uncharacterized protein METZ01_LOCUS305254 [marine metagenome]|uniref:Uncharacterized protein n=1 Tax=marine metagenome TaxID=408172 RepID=A0A382MV33_9ZZZZ
MVEKTTKVKKANKKTSSIKTKKKSKAKSKNLDTYDDSGIVLIDDDLEIDTEKVSEERKAYLEESRSQDASE